MRVTVLLFASHREAAGTHTHVLDVPEGSTVADAFALVRAAFPRIANDASRVAFALNANHVTADAIAGEGDEIAFLPPVAGG